jgi:carboxymethylenebutenolidase
MDEKITSFYADYKQGRTSRRDFVRKLALVSGSTAAAMAILPVLEYGNLKTPGTTQDDPELMSEFIKYPGVT